MNRTAVCVLSVAFFGLPVSAAPDTALLWRIFDKEIAGMEAILAEKKATMLGGKDYAKPVSPSARDLELFTAQTDLLKEIRKSGDSSIARQYLVVYFLMMHTSASAAIKSGELPEERKKLALESVAIYESMLKVLEYQPPKS
jgi:hypothetical protein